MKLVADENIPGIDRLFAPHFDEIVRLPGRSMAAADVRDADALIVRSVTKVNQSLIKGSSLSFVGTCTIGVDHLDTEALEAAGIKWCSAPGCNAVSVADYVVAACAALERPIEGQRVAVIGAGNVGKRVIDRMRLHGADVRVYDPFLSAPLVTGQSLDELFGWAEVICLHAPLTRSGPYPTAAMINRELVAKCANGTLIVSAGRGPVVTDEAVMSRADIDWVLDVWDDERNLRRHSIDQAKIATAHIAGYADEGKIRGTWMVFNEWAATRGLPKVPWSTVAGEKLTPTTGSLRWQDRILSVYDIWRDDNLLRSALRSDPEENGKAFDLLRKNYPGRHELDQYNWPKG